MRTGNQLLGHAKPKWTDPLSDERTKTEDKKSTLSTQQFTKLQNFLAKKAEEEKFTSQDANTVKQMVGNFFSTGNPKKSTKSVLNTDDDSKATRSKRDPAPDDFDGKWNLRCFVCPVSDTPHEFGDCETALTAGNKLRRQRAANLVLCMACLSRTCRKEAEENNDFWNCKNKKLWIPCHSCTQFSESKGNENWTNSQFVCTFHHFSPDPQLLSAIAVRIGCDPDTKMVF